MTSPLAIMQHWLRLSCRLRLLLLCACNASNKVHIIAAGAGEEQHSPHDSHEHSQSLSDGRMDVGTHLPLMAKRYAYLSLLGEGTSAQVGHYNWGASAGSLKGNLTSPEQDCCSCLSAISASATLDCKLGCP